MCFSLFVVVLHGATGIGSDRLGGSDSLSSFKLHSIQFAAFKMENVAQLNAVAQQSILSLRCDAEFAPSVQGISGYAHDLHKWDASILAHILFVQVGAVLMRT
jgi:hypothetical protein